MDAVIEEREYFHKLDNILFDCVDHIRVAFKKRWALETGQVWQENEAQGEQFVQTYLNKKMKSSVRQSDSQSVQKLKSGKLEDWDITLLTKVICNFMNYDTFKIENDSIRDLKNMRNYTAHHTTRRLTREEYLQKEKQFCDCLKKLNVPESIISSIIENASSSPRVRDPDTLDDFLDMKDDRHIILSTLNNSGTVSKKRPNKQLGQIGYVDIKKYGSSVGIQWNWYGNDNVVILNEGVFRFLLKHYKSMRMPRVSLRQPLQIQDKVKQVVSNDSHNQDKVSFGGSSYVDTKVLTEVLSQNAQNDPVEQSDSLTTAETQIDTDDESIEEIFLSGDPNEDTLSVVGEALQAVTPSNVRNFLEDLPNNEFIRKVVEERPLPQNLQRPVNDLIRNLSTSTEMQREVCEITASVSNFLSPFFLR